MQPVASAAQRSESGQMGQHGASGVHCSAPKSIIPWLKSPGRSGGSKDWARAVNSFFAAVEPTGVSRPKQRASTRYTLPSTTAAGSPKAMEPMAAAV